LSKVHKSSLDLITKAGYDKLTGLPYQINSLVMFYNKDIFDKFGVPHPKENMTWAETADLARRVTRQDGGIQYVGLASQQDWHNVMRSNQFSLEPIDPVTHKATFDGWKVIFEEMMPVFQIPGNEVRNSATGIRPSKKRKRLPLKRSIPAAERLNGEKAAQ
jgi:multiple sugar transport system substrate-binding protein